MDGRFFLKLDDKCGVLDCNTGKIGPVCYDCPQAVRCNGKRKIDNRVSVRFCIRPGFSLTVSANEFEDTCTLPATAIR